MPSYYAIIYFSLEVSCEARTARYMLKQKIVDILTEGIIDAQRAGKLPSLTPPKIVIERPQNPEHGDYASSIPSSWPGPAADTCWR